MRVPRPAARMSTSSGAVALLAGGVCPSCAFVACLSINLSARRAGQELARARSLFVAGDDQARQFVGAVPDFLLFIEQVCAHDLSLRAELFFEFMIGQTDLPRALGGVTLRLLGADRAVVDQHVVELDLRRVLAHGFEMLPRSVAVGLARLGHPVADK